MTDHSRGFLQNGAPGTDNRHYLRQSITAALDLDDDNGGIVVDMSEGGLRIQAVRELTAGKFLDLRFQPWDLNAWLEAKGRVVWTSETKKFAGVEFIGLPDQTRQMLRGFLGQQAEDRAAHGMGANTTVWPAAPRASRAQAAAARPAVISAAVALPRFEKREIETRIPAFILDARSDEEADRPASPKAIAFAVLFCFVVVAATWFARSGGLSGSLQELQSLISEKRGIAQTIPTVAASPASSAIAQAPAPAQSIDSNPTAPASSAPARDLGTLLQVAAMSHEENATALVESLDEKHFPAFILRQGANTFYRVTIGPYRDRRSIDAAKEKLGAQGLNFIEKRWLP